MKYQLLAITLSGLIILCFVLFFTNDTDDSVIPIPNLPSQETVEILPNYQERVGRLFMVGHWADTPVASTTDLIKNYGVGGVIIMSAPENPNDIIDWTSTWQAASEYPLVIAIDQEGGDVSRLKGPNFIQTSQPEILTKEQAFEIAKQRGNELASLGINTNFAPVIEASVSPDSFLYNRTFRNPNMIALLARATINGYRATTVTSVIKHYPGHEDEATDSHTELPIIEFKNTSFSEHTSNFNELISLNIVDGIMTAHVMVPSIDAEYPATLSKKILTGELRSKQKYDGIIITDDMTMDAIDKSFSTSEASILALNAGADIILFAAEPQAVVATIKAVQEAMLTGVLPNELIHEHYTRIEKWLRN